MLELTSSEALSLSVMLEYLKDVLSVRTVVKLEAVVMEFIEYLCCFDKGLSNISSEVFSHGALGSLQWLLDRVSLLPHTISSSAMCAWFCIV